MKITLWEQNGDSKVKIQELDNIEKVVETNEEYKIYDKNGCFYPFQKDKVEIVNDLRFVLKGDKRW